MNQFLCLDPPLLLLDNKDLQIQLVVTNNNFSQKGSYPSHATSTVLKTATKTNRTLLHFYDADVLKTN